MKITKQKIKNLIIILIAMIIFSLSCVFYSSLNPFFIKLFAEKFNTVSNKDNLLVHFIDVDQADAAAINFPDGKIMLIDTGSEEVNTTYVNYLKENVLHTKRNKYIDYLFLSHADMDHVGGTLKLLKNFEVGTIFMPKIQSDSNSYAEIINFVAANCNYNISGDDFTITGVGYEIRFFEQLNSTNTNDASQVIKVEYLNKSFLFCGDISASVEQLYIDKYAKELDCDVLKVSHHGSKTATSSEFLNVVSPNHAVISVGENDYGHPTYEVLTRLKSAGANILRTDERNDILFVLGENCDLYQIDGIYYITRFSLNYVGFVLIVDGCLVVLCVVVIFKKEKTNTLNNLHKYI